METEDHLPWQKARTSSMRIRNTARDLWVNSKPCNHKSTSNLFLDTSSGAGAPAKRTSNMRLTQSSTARCIICHTDAIRINKAALYIMLSNHL